MGLWASYWASARRFTLLLLLDFPNILANPVGLPVILCHLYDVELDERFVWGFGWGFLW
jgi:hypothetical protein